MELIKNFGIEPTLFVAQIINFLIIFYVLKRFAYKPILDLLKKREQTIKDGLRQAEEARILLEKTEDKQKEMLRKTQAQVRKMLDEAKQQKIELLEKAEISTKAQVEKMMQEARNQIAFETKEVEKRLSSQVTNLAVDFLQKSITELFSEKDQEQIMENALRKLKKQTN